MPKPKRRPSTSRSVSPNTWLGQTCPSDPALHPSSSKTTVNTAGSAVDPGRDPGPGPGPGLVLVLVPVHRIGRLPDLALAIGRPRGHAPGRLLDPGLLPRTTATVGTAEGAPVPTGVVATRMIELAAVVAIIEAGIIETIEITGTETVGEPVVVVSTGSTVALIAGPIAGPIAALPIIIGGRGVGVIAMTAAAAAATAIAAAAPASNNLGDSSAATTAEAITRVRAPVYASSSQRMDMPDPVWAWIARG